MASRRAIITLTMKYQAHSQVSPESSIVLFHRLPRVGTPILTPQPSNRVPLYSDTKLKRGKCLNHRCSSGCALATYLQVSDTKHALMSRLQLLSM